MTVARSLFQTQQKARAHGGSELRRILHLPKRDPIEYGEALVQPYTQRLKTPNGTQTLRPLQALTLAEAEHYRGVVVALSVGVGKTLITYLLPTVLGSRRPVLLLPARHIEKCEREFKKLAQHWRAARLPFLISYNKISNDPELLDRMQPDLIMADEAQALGNPDSGVTQRVGRYMRKHPNVVFIPLTGSLVKRSFRDYWHLLTWSLPAHLMPLPFDRNQMLSWCEALDEKVENPRPLGDLKLFGKTVKEVRESFGVRLASTPAIIVSPRSNTKARAVITKIKTRVATIDAALAHMRKTWTTPNGIEFSEGSELWRHARECANGFYYVWDPQPPAWWLQPRQEYNRFVREKLKRSKVFDTRSQVDRAFEDHPVVISWREVKKEFTPNRIPIWFDYSVIHKALCWARSQTGLVWVEHDAVGEKLDEYGIRYYSKQGRNGAGDHVDHARGSIAVSGRAIGEGFNLQRYSKNLILNLLPTGRIWEQVLGRTIRSGQKEEFVSVEILITVEEQLEGFQQASNDAKYIEKTTAQEQKLFHAIIQEREDT